MKALGNQHTTHTISLGDNTSVFMSLQYRCQIIISPDPEVINHSGQRQIPFPKLFHGKPAILTLHKFKEEKSGGQRSSASVSSYVNTNYSHSYCQPSLCQALYTHLIYMYEADTVIPILQMRKPRPGEIVWFPHSCYTSEGQRR